MVVRVSRRTALSALTLPLVASATGCLAQRWDDLPPSTVTIATGNPGGVFTRYGAALSTVLSDRLTNVTAEIRLTDASVQNLRLVSAGTCDLGLSLGDTASDAVRGTGPFDEPLDVVALARTYDSFVHLVVRDESGIRTAADLRGRRVGLGAPDSGTRVVARRVLKQYGLTLADIEVASESLQASAQGLRDGRLAAFFFVSGLPNQAVLGLSGEIAIRLLELDDVVGSMVDAYGPEYVAGPVPASTYGLPGAVDTVSVRNFVVVHPEMPDDLAYAITRTMFEAQDAIERVSPGVRQPTLGAAIFTSPLDLHPGAMRYYREQRP